jgi:hypothetical protein
MFKNFKKLLTTCHSLLTNERGAALFLSVIVLSTVLAIGLGVSTLLWHEIRGAREIDRFVPVIYGADAGVEKALWHIRRDPANPFATCPNIGACSVASTVMTNNVTYRAIILDGGTVDFCSSAALSKCIRAIGSLSNTNRAMEVNW